MNTGERARRLRKLLVTRLASDEVFFVCAVVAMIIVVGAVAHSPTTQIYLLCVGWSGLVGLMVPRWLEARRGAEALAAAREREARQRVTNHDLASAMLTIEGGLMALRGVRVGKDSARDEEVATQLEAITTAIEVEIRRMRRIAVSKPCRRSACWVADTLDPLLALHRAGGAEVDIRFPADVEVSMAPDDLVRVVSNVLDNCAKYAPSARITVSGEVRDEFYRLVIRDEGPGMPVDLIDHAFERSVSSRVDGGLGLFSARVLVETAGGCVSVESLLDGLAVCIELPVRATRTPQEVNPSNLWGATTSPVRSPLDRQSEVVA